MLDFLKYGVTLTLSLWLTSCNTVRPLCTTPCGTRLMGVLETGDMPEGWACEDLNRAEEALVSVAPAILQNVCKAAKDVEIYHDPAHPFYYRNGPVAGVTFCDRHLVVLSNLPLTVSAYAHEMFHVAQGCAAPRPADQGLDDSHANWNRDSIYSAINRWHLLMQEDN